MLEVLNYYKDKFVEFSAQHTLLEIGNYINFRTNNDAKYNFKQVLDILSTEVPYNRYIKILNYPNFEGLIKDIEEQNYKIDYKFNDVMDYLFNTVSAGVCVLSVLESGSPYLGLFVTGIMRELLSYYVKNDYYKEIDERWAENKGIDYKFIKNHFNDEYLFLELLNINNALVNKTVFSGFSYLTQEFIEDIVQHKYDLPEGKMIMCNFENVMCL
jgi:hypothetical protein